LQAALPKAKGDSYEALIANLSEVIEACLSVDLADVEISDGDKVIELAV
jgi:predicted RNase H-like HicB family nuclease